MKTRAKIKIIKKHDVIITRPPIVAKKSRKETTTRAIVSTVSDWVNEFQNRRYKETRQTFDQLFTPDLQTVSVVTC